MNTPSHSTPLRVVHEESVGWGGAVVVVLFSGVDAGKSTRMFQNSTL